MSNIMLSSNNKKPLVKKILLLFSQKDIHKGHVVLAIIRELFIQITCYTRVYICVYTLSYIVYLCVQFFMCGVHDVRECERMYHTPHITKSIINTPTFIGFLWAFSLPHYNLVIYTSLQAACCACKSAI